MTTQTCETCENPLAGELADACPTCKSILEPRYHVKVKLAGKKQFKFLTATGGTTHLLVHAPTWNKTGAEEIARQIVIDNPAAVEEAKAVPA